jgi:hypothetical protein
MKCHQNYCRRCVRISVETTITVVPNRRCVKSPLKKAVAAASNRRLNSCRRHAECPLRQPLPSRNRYRSNRCLCARSLRKQPLLSCRTSIEAAAAIASDVVETAVAAALNLPLKQPSPPRQTSVETALATVPNSLQNYRCCRAESLPKKPLPPRHGWNRLHAMELPRSKSPSKSRL